MSFTVPKKPKTRGLLIRVTEEQRDAIKALAVLYADGDMSKLIRYVVLNFKPTQE